MAPLSAVSGGSGGGSSVIDASSNTPLAIITTLITVQNTSITTANTPASVSYTTSFVTVYDAVTSSSPSRAGPKDEHVNPEKDKDMANPTEKDLEALKNSEVWGTVVPSQEVVIDGQTVEVVAVMTGGP